MNTLLNMDDVHAYYGAAHILQGMSLRVDEGERVALIGRNGVGKTTTVNALMGLARVGAGQIRLGGTVVRKAMPYTPAQLRVAIVPQGRCIIANLTIEENLMLGSAVRNQGPWNLSEVYRLFPILKERARTPGTALSGGQQQMLAIGRSLMANPRLMILDEPTEGLAPVVVDQLADTLNLVTNQGTAILLIEQNLGLVTRTTSRYYAVEKGRVSASGTVDPGNSAALHSHIAV
ncbi:ABC transporter ATP-binding protein [Castellaniella sp. UC4442_H9]|jgi:branched-chain amino acid transport system ATP-binding protein|nr:ABC transporter ATP-binding protein [Castellaniella sp.]